MRKDVKVGFAIGGILIAVLIAYVLVSGKGKPQPVEVAEGEVQQVQPVGQEQTVTPAPEQAQTEQPAPDSATPPEPVKPADPFAGNKPSGEDVWAAALTQGKVLMSVTPTAEAAKPVVETRVEQPAPRSPVEAAVAANTAATTIAMQPPATRPESIVPPRPETRDVAKPTGAGRTHVVRSGETLTAISIAAFGDQKYWRKIAAANPAIDPDRLKVGQTIVLPDLNTKQQATAAFNGGARTTLDARTQYEVQSGDSLNRIARKLYGKETFWAKIYELNKDQIGADPARLKVGMVLKLPVQAVASR